jgi:hypothetical protein
MSVLRLAARPDTGRKTPYFIDSPEQKFYSPAFHMSDLDWHKTGK